MAVTAYWYGLAFTSAFNKEIDLNDTNVKCALATASYTPDQDTHDYFNDITNEVSGATGYSADGTTLANPAMTYTAGTNVWKFDADDCTWGSSYITARYGIIYYDNSSVATTSALICYIDFGQDMTSSNGDFKIAFNADGICKVTAS
ncbi:MAG: hypothetical protein ABIH46_07875 [Chloroflexota bacterium]